MGDVVAIGRGKFFAVDRRAWAAVCDLGSMNAAVSYLVMASGTQGDHRTTSWSVNAIETHTGVPRYLAKAAIEKLIAAGVATRTQGGSRPRYVLARATDIPSPFLRDLSDAEHMVLAVIEQHAPGSTWTPKVGRYGDVWGGGKPFDVALGLVRKKLLRHVVGQHFAPLEPVEDRPDWIWVPRTCIEGADRETPPVELLRQSASLPALRLFVDLYHAQSLARHGGVHWRQLRLEFEKHKVGEQGAFKVWGFVRKNPTTWLTAPFVAPHVDLSKKDAPARQFWDALNLIIRCGLADYVGHVIEADTNEAAILFPYGMGNGEPEEQAIASAAHQAGLGMLQDWQVPWVEDHDAWLVPLRPHMPNAILVGLLRLRYQAATDANAEWVRRKAGWSVIADAFRGEGEKPSEFGALQHQMEIKWRSSRDQL